MFIHSLQSSLPFLPLSFYFAFLRVKWCIYIKLNECVFFGNIASLTPFPYSKKSCLFYRVLKGKMRGLCWWGKNTDVSDIYMYFLVVVQGHNLIWQRNTLYYSFSIQSHYFCLVRRPWFGAIGWFFIGRDTRDDAEGWQACHSLQCLGNAIRQHLMR